MSNVIHSVFLSRGARYPSAAGLLGHENIRHTVRYTEPSSVVDAQIY
jgi:hypothetical protein